MGGVCSGAAGVCDPEGVCRCKDAHVGGPACERECPKHGSIVCGHGVCSSAVGECTCESGYLGLSCGLQERDVRRQYCNGPVLIRGATLPDELAKYGDVCGGAGGGRDGPTATAVNGTTGLKGECNVKKAGSCTVPGERCVDVSCKGAVQARFECGPSAAGAKRGGGVVEVEGQL